MNNNAIIGFMFQNLICKKFKLNVNENSKKMFESNYEENLDEYINSIINEIFDNISLVPVEYVDLTNNKKAKYNFKLSDGKTLSIRTNINGYKIAPREVGQAGFKKLNEYFSKIYCSEILGQEDIKKLIYYKIDEALPIFIDKFLDADYLLWIYDKKGKLEFMLIDSMKQPNIMYNYNNFTFSKNIDEWNESITLKYIDQPIAEIQVHKKRSFKFRFNMMNLIKYLNVIKRSS